MGRMKRQQATALVPSGPASPFGPGVPVKMPEQPPQPHGRPTEDFIPRPLEPGYVEPMDRMNPEHLQKAREEQARRDRMKSAMGYAVEPKIVNPSPASMPRVTSIFGA